MFNDVLTRGECEVLVRRLAGTGRPWCCAHGRPSLVGVVGVGEDLGSGGGCGLGMLGMESKREGEVGFGEAWRKWREKGEGV